MTSPGRVCLKDVSSRSSCATVHGTKCYQACNVVVYELGQRKERGNFFFPQGSDTKTHCCGVDQVEIIIIFLPVSMSYS